MSIVNWILLISFLIMFGTLCHWFLSIFLFYWKYKHYYIITNVKVIDLVIKFYLYNFEISSLMTSFLNKIVSKSSFFFVNQYLIALTNPEKSTLTKMIDLSRHRFSRVAFQRTRMYIVLLLLLWYNLLDLGKFLLILRNCRIITKV